MMKWTFLRLIGVLIGLTVATTLPAQIFLNAPGNLPNSGSMRQSMDVQAADLDADGDLDIILANEFQGNTLLRNDGTGTFSNMSTNLPQFSRDSEDVAVADFDQDGDLDLVFCSEDDVDLGGQNVHEFYLNDGNGQFSIASYQFPDSKANAVIATDLNADGFPDLIFGNDGQNRILINLQNGQFADETITRLPSIFDTTQDLQLADVDGDDDLDLFVGNENGNRLLINGGDGLFVDETVARLPGGLNIETRKVTFADIDADGDLDVFLANVQFIPGKIRRNRLFENDGTGHFTDVSVSQLPADNEDSLDGIFVDVDLDNDLDLLVANVNLGISGKMRAYFNNGSGEFTEATAEVFGTNYFINALGIIAADLNGDGLEDLYVCDRNTGNSNKDLLLLQDELNFNPIEPSLPWVLFPNPVQDRLQVRFNEALPAPALVSLFDIAGRLVEQPELIEVRAGHYEIDFSAFPQLLTGTYWLQVKAGKKQWSGKINLSSR